MFIEKCFMQFEDFMNWAYVGNPNYDPLFDWLQKIEQYVQHDGWNKRIPSLLAVRAGRPMHPASSGIYAQREPGRSTIQSSSGASSSTDPKAGKKRKERDYDDDDAPSSSSTAVSLTEYLSPRDNALLDSLLKESIEENNELESNRIEKLHAYETGSGLCHKLRLIVVGKDENEFQLFVRFYESLDYLFENFFDADSVEQIAQYTKTSKRPFINPLSFYLLRIVCRNLRYDPFEVRRETTH